MIINYHNIPYVIIEEVSEDIFKCFGNEKIVYLYYNKIIGCYGHIMSDAGNYQLTTRYEDSPDFCFPDSISFNILWGCDDSSFAAFWTVKNINGFSDYEKKYSFTKFSEIKKMIPSLKSNFLCLEKKEIITISPQELIKYDKDRLELFIEKYKKFVAI